MISNYEMWLTHNGESEKLQFPVLPELYTVSNGSRNQSVDVAGLGEIVIKQSRPALGIRFNSFFPYASFPGIRVSTITAPETLKNRVMNWKNSDKPVHFLITGTDINLYCTIEDFPYEERGGDVCTIHFTLSLKEYREVSARQVTVDSATRKATLPEETGTRTDNRVQQQTYTVVKGDSLWSIAARHLGSGSQFTDIYSLNKDQISNPNLIYPGQVLKLPA